MVFVLLWHADVKALSGGFVGVDVFFVISGFLITGFIVSEIEGTGRFSLVGFYARRAKRVLPAAAVVLVSSLVLTYLFLPRARWSQTGWDVVSSGLYAINWRLAERSVDYLAADQAPSVVQHFWSLAVEEQFYLLWPLLLLLVAALTRRSRQESRRWLRLTCVVLIAAPSLAWSTHLSDIDSGRAYFQSTTRVWELALGAGLAMFADSLDRLPRLVAVVLGWAGLAAVIVAVVAFGAATSFPGYAALLPTLGAVAVIAAGPAAGRLGPIAILGTSVGCAIGAMSYSLYLWHFPAIVAAEALFGELRSAQLLVVVVLSAVPAYLTFRFVENPFRFSYFSWRSPVTTLRYGLIFTAIPVLCGVFFQFTLWPSGGVSSHSGTSSTNLTGSPSGSAKVGAEVLSDSPRGDMKGAPVDRVDSISPDPEVASRDMPELYAEGCANSLEEDDPKSCVYGNLASRFTIAIVGDSHAAQWAPALQDYVSAKGWRLVVFTKASCPLSAAEVAIQGKTYKSCTTWNKRVMVEILGKERPNVVITSSSEYQVIRNGVGLGASDNRVAMVQGFHSAWRALSDAGITTIVIRNTPYTRTNTAECVSRNMNHLTRCAVAREIADSSVGPFQIEAAQGIPGIHVVDLNDAICPTEKCAAVIGGVLVYRDGNHLTSTYVVSLEPRLTRELDGILGK